MKSIAILAFSMASTCVHGCAKDSNPPHFSTLESRTISASGTNCRGESRRSAAGSIYERLGLKSVKVPGEHVNDTNLHFHGLTVSPHAPGDDSLKMLRPGSSTEYVVDISPHQPPGLYWYHPHPHGESSWQAGNGMSGALVVNGIQDDVPDVAGLRERLLIVHQAVSENENEVRAAAGRKFSGLKRMTPVQRAPFLKRAGVATPSTHLEETSLTINGIPAGTMQSVSGGASASFCGSLMRRDRATWIFR